MSHLQVVRAYTPLSSAEEWDDGELELLVRVYAGGAMTVPLSQMKPTETVSTLSLFSLSVYPYLYPYLYLYSYLSASTSLPFVHNECRLSAVNRCKCGSYPPRVCSLQQTRRSWRCALRGPEFCLCCKYWITYWHNHLTLPPCCIARVVWLFITQLLKDCSNVR